MCVYSENTVVIQDKSTDAKLDYLISEMETLKSQKSSGDEKIDEKVINENSSWFEKYGYENRGLGFGVYEDFSHIYYSETVNEKNFVFVIAYSKVGSNAMKKIISVNQSHSGTANIFGVGLNYNYYFTDKIKTNIGVAAGYAIINWQDNEEQTSGDDNFIFPSFMCGVFLSPFQFSHPFPMNVGINISLSITPYPSSYEIDTDGIVTHDDWQIKLLPGFTFAFEIPK